MYLNEMKEPLLWPEPTMTNNPHGGRQLVPLTSLSSNQIAPNNFSPVQTNLPTPQPYYTGGGPYKAQYNNNYVDDDGLFRLIDGQVPSARLGSSGSSTVDSPGVVYELKSPVYRQQMWQQNNQNYLHQQQQQPQQPQQQQESALNSGILLDYVKFPKKIFKTQKRIKGKSEQRIEDGELKVTLTFTHPEISIRSVKTILVHVVRTNDFPESYKYVGPVPLHAKFHSTQHAQYLVTVDLDSVYEVNGKKVYELQKTLMEELNSFHLDFHIHLLNGEKVMKKTKDFLLVGKKHAGQVAVKSKRKDSISSDEAFNEPRIKSFKPSFDQDIIHAQRVVTDHIKTKTLEIEDGNIFIGNTIQTPNGDIAYHFCLNDSTEVFAEGEVVGLVLDKADNKQKICKLNLMNISDSILKGVITRSQYLEAHKPTLPEVKSETVCMMGTVPVKVEGPVEANDPLYASPTTPGVVVSGRLLSMHHRNDLSLVGYAFEEVHAEGLTISYVQAGVSVLSTASEALLNNRIREMTSSIDHKVHVLTKKNSKSRKRLYCCLSLSIVFALLASILLWQVLLPGTAYRYYLCQRNALSQKVVSFSYDPGHHLFNTADVNGIEFYFKKLMEKKNLDYQPYNATGTRYYLNLDRCAYGGMRATEDLTTGDKRVYGPDIFATDTLCQEAYQYFGVLRKWVPMKDVRWKVTSCQY